MARSKVEARRRHIQEIRENPEKHRHESFRELVKCCLVDGELDSGILDAHQGVVGFNGGRLCDIKSGPCSCGAWH